MIMNVSTNPKKLRGFEQYVRVDNVSRRSILKSLSSAWCGGVNSLTSSTNCSRAATVSASPAAPK